MLHDLNGILNLLHDLNGILNQLHDLNAILPLQYNFEGRLDLVKFVKTVHSHGLLMNLRIGPYACAEWNYG
jgi:hypothetical protein